MGLAKTPMHLHAVHYREFCYDTGKVKASIFCGEEGEGDDERTVLRIESWGAQAEFSPGQLDWLIKCLKQIKKGRKG